MSESKKNNNDFSNLLLNINGIFVRPYYVDDYIKFSYELDEYLCSKYPEFYAGLQLYQSKEDKSCFTVVAAYYDVPCICKEVRKIREDIEEIYNDIWRNNLKRISILYFCDELRIF